MKQLIILVPSGENNLSSIVGAYKFFSRANARWKEKGREPLFQIRLAGQSKRVSYYENRFSARPDMDIRDVKRADLIIVPSLNHNYQQAIRSNQRIIPWLETQYQSGAAIASICTGAFLLAAAGLLDGRSCSTHWSAADQLHRLFPTVRLQADRLVTEEKGIMTNGGAYSFLHFLLYLIEKYYDRETAVYCAKVFQVDMDRQSQSPFMIFSGQKQHDDELIQKAQAYIESHPADHFSMDGLSKKLAIGRRHFDRRFIRATGHTPVEYFQRVRIETAKKALERGRKTVREVMFAAGYSDAKAFREVFKKITGMTPQAYRVQYDPSAATKRK